MSSARTGEAVVEAAGWEVWCRGLRALGAAAGVNVALAAVDEKEKDSRSDGVFLRQTPTRKRTEWGGACRAICVTAAVVGDAWMYGDGYGP